MPYSQGQEEEIVTAYFAARPSEKRRFLDIGAHDGITFSNTRRLTELGWDGVLVEPTPETFATLKANCADYPHLRLVNAAIGPRTGLTTFHQSGDSFLCATGDVIEAHRAKWTNNNFDRVYYVCQITLEHLFDHVGDNFDFVSIDTESFNRQLFDLFPWGRISPACICVEHDLHHGHMTGVLAAMGYKKLYFSGENLIMGRP